MGSQAKIVNFAEITANFELTPQQALEYFLGKGVKPTFNWADMMGAEHDTAFTVAKMMDTDLLATVKGKLDKALESGMTLQQFQKELIPLDALYSYYPNVLCDPLLKKKTRSC